MERDVILLKLTEIFEDVFQKESLSINDLTVAADISGWDSLSNIQMVIAVERGFKIRLSAAQVSGLKNVGSLVSVIQSKLPVRA